MEILFIEKQINYELRTPLGVDDCVVKIIRNDEYLILAQGEDDRIRTAQVRLFLDWVISNNEDIDKEQLRYILLVTDINITNDIKSSKEIAKFILGKL